MKYRYSVEQKERILTDPFLTDRERDVFVYIYLQGWHIEDVAAELEVSRGTINNILREIHAKHPPAA